MIEPLEIRRMLAATPPTAPFVPGRLGNALELNSGGTLYADMGDPADGHLDPALTATIEFWVKFDASPGNLMAAFVSKDEGPGKTNKWIFGYTASGMLTNQEAAWPTATVWASTSGGVGYTFVPGQWYHLAYVRDGDKEATYVNGILKATGSTNLPIPVNNGHFLLGRAENTFAFQGAIDDVRLWKTARTQTQIQTYKGVELTGTEWGLVGYWKMNETGGTTVADASPFRTSGRLSSADLPMQPTDKPVRPNAPATPTDPTPPTPHTNAAPTATLAVTAGVEGGTLVATMGGATDADAADVVAGFRYSFDYGDDGTFEVIGSQSPQWATTARDSGVVKVRGRVMDQNGEFTDYVQTVTVGNLAPTGTFSAGGGVAEGSAGAVSFKNLFDPSANDVAAGFKYSYDFDGDGTFDVVRSTSPNAVVPAQYLADGPGARTVIGRVEDKDGGHTDYSATIAIENVAPAVTVGGQIVLGTDYVLSLAATDPGADTVRSWVVNWGDGATSSLMTATGLASHEYVADGEYTVLVTMVDDDGTFQSSGTVRVTKTVRATNAVTNEAPVAASMAAAALAAGQSAQRVTVTYTDDLGVDVATLGDDDLLVRKAGTASTLGVRLASVKRSEDGRVVLAQYDVADPDGTGWDWRESGTYEVAIRAGAVADSQGMTAAAGAVGTFWVNLKRPDGPDLVARIDGAGKTLAPAGANRVTVKVSNRGTKNLSATAGKVGVTLYLSTDPVWDAADVLVGSVVKKIGLSINGSWSAPMSFVTPKAVLRKGGTYYLVARVSVIGTATERDDRNNSAASGAIRALAKVQSMAAEAGKASSRSSLRTSSSSG